MERKIVSLNWPHGLSIIHSNHLEDLREVAVRWICSHPLKPLENEVFLVQSNGNVPVAQIGHGSR